MPPKTIAVAEMSADEISLLQEGDIILRRGYGWISDFILKTFDEKIPVTHCGIVVFENKEWHVIHSESNNDANGVQMIPLREFLRASYPQTIAVVRPHPKNLHTAQTIVRRSKYYLQQGYKFDMGFDDKDSTELYCTEMVQMVLYHSFAKNLLPERIEIGANSGARLRNFFNYTYFKTIILQYKK
jgi:hypothetical protein